MTRRYVDEIADMAKSVETLLGFPVVVDRALEKACLRFRRADGRGARVEVDEWTMLEMRGKSDMSRLSDVIATTIRNSIDAEDKVKIEVLKDRGGPIKGMEATSVIIDEWSDIEKWSVADEIRKAKEDKLRELMTKPSPWEMSEPGFGLDKLTDAMTSTATAAKESTLTWEKMKDALDSLERAGWKGGKATLGPSLLREAEKISAPEGLTTLPISGMRSLGSFSIALNEIMEIARISIVRKPAPADDTKGIPVRDCDGVLLGYLPKRHLAGLWVVYTVMEDEDEEVADFDFRSKSWDLISEKARCREIRMKVGDYSWKEETTAEVRFSWDKYVTIRQQCLTVEEADKDIVFEMDEFEPA